MASNKPTKVIRIGYVTASVFARTVTSEGGARTIHSVNLQKRYMDGDEVKYTSSLGLAELPQALHALKLATDWVTEQEAEVDLG